VRQPLSKAFVVIADATTRNLLSSVKGIIAEEINVKEVDFSDDEHPFVTLKAKPNFRVLGKRLGSRMPVVHHALEHLHYSKLQELLEHGTVVLHLEDGDRVAVSKEEVEVVRLVRDSVVAMHESGMTVALEVALDEALLAEGLAREVVNKLNTMRRDHDLAVTDRIVVYIQTSDRAKSVLEPFLPYIQEETLATSIVFGPAVKGTEWDLNGEPSVIAISKRTV
jgi:isoleucyl-tRNA synthetase